MTVKLLTDWAGLSAGQLYSGSDEQYLVGIGKAAVEHGQAQELFLNGTTWTLGARDVNRLIVTNSASAVTIRIPSYNFMQAEMGVIARIRQQGAGAVTVVNDSGVTVASSSAAGSSIVIRKLDVLTAAADGAASVAMPAYVQPIGGSGVTPASVLMLFGNRYRLGLNGSPLAGVTTYRTAIKQESTPANVGATAEAVELHFINKLAAAGNTSIEADGGVFTVHASVRTTWRGTDPRDTTVSNEQMLVTLNPGDEKIYRVSLPSLPLGPSGGEVTIEVDTHATGTSGNIYSNRWANRTGGELVSNTAGAADVTMNTAVHGGLPEPTVPAAAQVTWGSAVAPTAMRLLVKGLTKKPRGVILVHDSQGTTTESYNDGGTGTGLGDSYLTHVQQMAKNLNAFSLGNSGAATAGFNNAHTTFDRLVAAGGISHVDFQTIINDGGTFAQLKTILQTAWGIGKAAGLKVSQHTVLPFYSANVNTSMVTLTSISAVSSGIGNALFSVPHGLTVGVGSPDIGKYMFLNGATGFGGTNVFVEITSIPDTTNVQFRIPYGITTAATLTTGINGLTHTLMPTQTPTAAHLPTSGVMWQINQWLIDCKTNNRFGTGEFVNLDYVNDAASVVMVDPVNNPVYKLNLGVPMRDDRHPGPQWQKAIADALRPGFEAYVNA